MGFKLIISALKPDSTTKVVEAAKDCGVSGATIVPGRGTGIEEAKTFLGLTLEMQTDLILFMVEAELVQPVLDAIERAGRFDQHGTGIAFVLPIEEVTGIKEIVRRTPK